MQILTEGFSQKEVFMQRLKAAHARDQETIAGGLALLEKTNHDGLKSVTVFISFLMISKDLWIKHSHRCT